MNRNEYILKLKNLKSIIDKQLLMETYNYEKWWDPKNVVEGIIKTIMGPNA